MLYRGIYGDDTKSEAFQKALEDFVGGATEGTDSEGADPGAVVLKFGEDESALQDTPSQQGRK